MKNLIVVIFAAMILSGCGSEKEGKRQDDNPNIMNPSDNTGELVISWQSKSNDDEIDQSEKANPPVVVNVYLTPGGFVDGFPFQQAQGSVSDLNARTYDVRIEARDADGHKTHEGFKGGVNVVAGRSTQVSIDLDMLLPEVPSGVSASTTIYPHIRVSWNSSPRASSYKIFRSNFSGGPFAQVGYTSQTSWNDSGADPAKPYFYRVSATNSAGDSQRSNYVSGYRVGWRFDHSQVHIYDTPNGIGLKYDLFAYGFSGQTKRSAIFAVYRNGSSYYFVPGSGCLNFAAYCYNLSPNWEMTVFRDAWAVINDSTWHPNWRNNNYPQYIQIRVYTSSSINSLNAPVYAETGFYRIYWSENAMGKMIPRLIPAPSIDIDEGDLSIIEDLNSQACTSWSGDADVDPGQASDHMGIEEFELQ